MSRPVFDCTRCGSCCEGRGGIVVSPSDLLRLASQLRLDGDEVARRFGEYKGNKLHLRSTEQGHCVFFKAGHGCTVHEGKPSVCKAWPFFRGNLVDAESFAMAKEFCPGINPKASHAEFVAEGIKYLKTEQLIAHDPDREANALILD